MNWEEFFTELLWFIGIAILLDVVLLDGLFTEAIATRISGCKCKEEDKDEN